MSSQRFDQRDSKMIPPFDPRRHISRCARRGVTAVVRDAPLGALGVGDAIKRPSVEQRMRRSVWSNCPRKREESNTEGELLPAYVEPLLPCSVVSRPIGGEPSTVELDVVHGHDNPAPALSAFLSAIDTLIAAGLAGVRNWA